MKNAKCHSWYDYSCFGFCLVEYSTNFFLHSTKEKVVATLDFSLVIDEIEKNYEDQEENNPVDLYNFTSNFDANTPNTSNEQELNKKFLN